MMPGNQPLPQRVKAANVVPPGSTALREVLHAVSNALTLPTPATERDEVTYLRISRDHARELVWMCRRLLQGPRDFDDGDVMAVVNALRDKNRPASGRPVRRAPAGVLMQDQALSGFPEVKEKESNPRSVKARRRRQTPAGPSAASRFPVER